MGLEEIKGSFKQTKYVILLGEKNKKMAKNLLFGERDGEKK